ncbi:peptidoglycan-binding protein [Thalassiella azotivora]
MTRTRHRTAAALAVAGLLLAGCGDAVPGAAPAVTPTVVSPSTGTGQPATQPKGEPTEEPTGEPTSEPTGEPTDQPSVEPSEEPTPQPPRTSAPAPGGGSAGEDAPADGTLRPGDSGPQVLALQERLADLGYWLGTPDGRFGHLTTQAVYALQGAAGLARDGHVGPRTRAALDEGARPQARSSSGRVTEIDRERGLVLLVEDGRVEVALHTSTGTFREYTAGGRTLLADTPEGRYSVTWSHDGWRQADLGRLYRPRYFHPDGIAVHGFGSVPAYPASHGCARVSLPAMDMIWARDLMPRGSAVWVY